MGFHFILLPLAATAILYTQILLTCMTHVPVIYVCMPLLPRTYGLLAGLP